jgi:hypothetical protein
MDNRFTWITIPRKKRWGFRQRAPAFVAPLNAQFWCTGKDSNLRTPLGGADLQSAGFNHSPTCAETIGRCSRCAPYGSRFPARPLRRSLTVNRSPDPAQSHFFALETDFRKPGKPRIAREYHAKITTRRKSSEWSALEKPVAPLPSTRLPEFVSWSWRRDLNP